MFNALKLLGTDAGLDFEVALDPGKRFYCFFGANGVGKTNLLQNLARLLLSLHSLWLPKDSGAHRYAGIYSELNIREALKERALGLPLDIEIEGALVKDRKRDAWRFVDPDTLSIAESAFGDFPGRPDGSRPVVDRPVVVIGTSGRGHTAPLNKSELQFIGSYQEEFLRAFDRTWNAATNGEISTQSVAAWIAARLLVNPAFVVGSMNRAVEVAALCELLKELDPVFQDLIRRQDNRTTIDILFRDGNVFVGPTPIDKLATGYVAVVKILQEIISAYGAWGSWANATEIRALDGIVLIDELEAHLHPRWQIGLVALLKRAFPNTTFVVCTHSPLVVAQTQEGEAYELIRTGNSVKSRRLGSPRDWYLADVYANAFHIDLPPPGSRATDGEPTLADLLIEFSARVKDYLGQREEATRAQALVLHDQIAGRLPADDPRRGSLASLRGLLG